MKILAVIFALAAFSSSHFSQRNEYAGKSLGWLSTFDPSIAEKSVTLDSHVYSAKQMQVARIMIGWIRQSYTPLGSVGQTYKLANEKLGLYNEHTKAQPHRYGALSRTYIDLKKEGAGKWIPASNTNWFMQIAVNGVIGDRSYAITTPETWYFYIPGEPGLSPIEQEVANLDGFSSHPAFRKYISWYQPKGIGTTLQYVVLLCKDNVRPYVPVTKGEYLNELESSIRRSTSNAEQLAQRVSAVSRLREKYKSRLTEPAKTKEQPNLSLEHETGSDIFGSAESIYPVYKFTPEKLAAANTDQAQWIVISWEAEGVANNDEAGENLHRVMLQNLNYDFIYNYFFYPEKVRGAAYTKL